MIGVIRQRLAALPSYPWLAAGAVLWALVMGASAWLKLDMEGWQTSASIRSVVLIFFAGGLIAFPLALAVAVLVSPRPQARFSAALIALTAFSAGASAAIYGLQYRLYYSQWHGEPFSVGWTYQTVFTFAAGVYQFLVLGLRLYFPLGFLALFAASYWFARRVR
jgi:hypothetical protein